ncbi:MAG TPA: rhomboid family intramembrane serine protease [Vicinamibacterales bacterium]|nr:rhomboid family intramembrane serine protease [Vicinamibacterales bacterium]
MLRRQRVGSVVCPGCGTLVGVRDERCLTCGRWNPGLWGFWPLLRRAGADLGFVELVTAGCLALYALALLRSGAAIRTDGLFTFLSPSTSALFMFGASGALPVFGFGRWWTVLSAGWLHAGVLHILFNLLWVRQLGPPAVQLFGLGRTIIIYTLAGVAGFLTSSVAGWLLPPLPLLGGAQFTVGASAPIFGLLGALLYYGRQGSRLVRAEAAAYVAALFLFGLVMPGVDNWAHAGGFAGGYLAAWWLNPWRPERGDHLAGGLLCLLLTVAAVAGSVLDTLL